MTLPLHNIPFIKIPRKTLDELSKWPRDRNPYQVINQQQVYFVSSGDLEWENHNKFSSDKFTDYYTPRVMCSQLSFCHPNIERKGNTPDRFCYGVYYDSKDLLLVDDLIKWAHYSRIKSKDVRSAWDIIKNSKKHD